MNDLLEELRTGGILTPTEVGTAIMETSGKLSVFPASQARPATTEELKVKTGYEGIPLTLVMDGRLEKDNLPLCGKDAAWLSERLKKMGYARIQEVLLCYLDTDGKMTAHGYGDKPPARAQALSPDEVMW